MWMCAGCQSINDDPTKTCPVCGRVHVPRTDYGRRPHAQRNRIQQLPIALARATVSLFRPPLRNIPLLIALGFLFAVELLPAMQYGPSVFLLAIPSGIVLAAAILELDKRLTRIAQSTSTVGTVVRLDYTLDAGGRYCAVVGYDALGASWEVRDAERILPETCRAGDQVTVYYDANSPGDAILHCPLPLRPTLLVCAGVVLYCGSWLLGAQFAAFPPAG